MEDQKNKLLTWLPLLLGLCTAIGMYAGYKMQLPKVQNTDISKTVSQNFALKQKLDEVLAYLQTKYVDSLDAETTSDFIIQQMVFALDPYSEYLDHKELSNLHDQFDGIYQGAGLSFKIIDSTTYVSEVILEGPADQSGIEIGDLVSEINNIKLDSEHLYIDSIIQYASLNPEKLILKVSKNREDNLKEVSIDKTDLPNKTVSNVFSIDGKILYLKIEKFGETTYKEFMEELERYIFKKSYRKLIIDLRSNSGGILGAAADILNQLVKERNSELFKTVDRFKQVRSYKSTGKPFFQIDDIAVLINDETASASEVVAGVLQDLSRATIIGTNSFGKATVLELFPLSDGSSLELANARIFLPSGRCIQKPYDLRPDSSLRWLSPYLADTGFVALGNKHYINGHGILPDIYVEDVSKPTHEDLKIRDLADNFIIQHYQDLKPLSTKKNAESLISTYALKNWINIIKDPFILKNKEAILQQIHLQIVKLFYSGQEEMTQHLKDDPMISKALEVLK